MESSDLNLLQSVPPYHLQTVLKTRRLQQIQQGEHSARSSDALPDPSSMPLSEIAEYLFNPLFIQNTIRGLDDIEQLMLRELVTCGGRANSRDLALYFTLAGILLAGPRPKGKRDTKPLSGSNAPGEMTRNIHSPAPEDRSSGALRPLPSGLAIQYPTPHPHGTFEQALRHLLLLGLVFWSKQTNIVGRDYANGTYDGILIVPRVVIRVMNEAAGEGQPSENVGARFIAPAAEAGFIAPAAPNIETRSIAPTALPWSPDIGEGIRLLQRTLYLYWSIAAAMREGLPVVSSKLLSRPALRQVMDQLGRDIVSLASKPAWGGSMQPEQVRSENDVPYLLFIRLLLMQLGLLQERRGALYAVSAQEFFALPLLERVRRCYHLWLETPFWNELAYLPDVIVRPGPAPLEPAHQEAVQARQVVVELVLREQAEVWHELAAFVARTKLYAPSLLFPRQYGPRAERYSIGSNPYGWDFRLRRGWLTPREGWYQVEGSFIRSIVLSPLHWLGLVEINSDEHPSAFRLAPGISFVTSEIAPNIEEAPWGRLIVQPNFELVALAPVSEELLVKLDRFAERTRLEHIAQYRLTRASVTCAIQMGLQAETILQVLEQAAGGESGIPQNVQYSLVEWERQARRIELWQGATLLEVDDEALLDALFADEEARPLLGRRLAPLLAEVAPGQLKTLQEILWRRNYLPSIVSAPTRENLLESGRLPASEPQWRLQHNGLLQPCHSIPDLYLSAELERITEPDEATGWRRITPQAISEACASELDLEYVIRFLQNYCEGGIPASFLIRLKLWGGGYGERQTIQVEPAPLLSLSASALQDLQADEELGALLGTEVTSANRLVRVAPEMLERVMELLRERGFEIE